MLVVLNVTGLLLLPDRLILEITESGLMADQERAIRTVTRVHELGMGVSIDDFGSGYSSIAYLRRLHSTEVKMRAPCLDFRRADLADARPE